MRGVNDNTDVTGTAMTFVSPMTAALPPSTSLAMCGTLILLTH
jgi:hypothetical protein